MKITPVKALTDNYIWMIQHGNHAVCVDPSEPSPVLEFLVRNRLMLAQTWVTHPHPDHEGGAAALWRGYMESPVYGESDIEAATHTVTAGTRIHRRQPAFRRPYRAGQRRHSDGIEGGGTHAHPARYPRARTPRQPVLTDRNPRRPPTCRSPGRQNAEQRFGSIRRPARTEKRLPLTCPPKNAV